MAQTKDYYAVLGVASRDARTRSRSSTGGSRSGTIRTPTRTTPRPPTASRRSPRRTTSSATPRSGSSTTTCAGSARSATSAAARPGGAGGAAPAPAPQAGAGAGGGDSRSRIRLRHRRPRRTRRPLQLDVRRRPRGRGQATDAEQGQTVETTLEVPFRVAALGGKVPVELEVNEECATCHGNGAAPGATVKVCPECKGRGVISFGQGGFAVNRPCPMCLGRGQVPSERCPTCSGAGEVRARKKLMITVPPGIDYRHEDPPEGAGRRGASGGAAGRPADHVPGAAGPVLSSARDST